MISRCCSWGPVASIAVCCCCCVGSAAKSPPRVAKGKASGGGRPPCMPTMPPAPVYLDTMPVVVNRLLQAGWCLSSCAGMLPRRRAGWGRWGGPDVAELLIGVFEQMSSRVTGTIREMIVCMVGWERKPSSPSLPPPLHSRLTLQCRHALSLALLTPTRAPVHYVIALSHCRCAAGAIPGN